MLRNILSSRPSQRLIERLRQTPLVRNGIKSLYDYHFENASGYQRKFRGVYASFDQAFNAAPKTKPLGYDTPETALISVDNYRIIIPSDYPVLFWLKPALAEAKVLFDLGGNVGISFYSYQKYLRYPANLTWLVCDVPTVVEQGQQVALAEKSNGLAFTSDLGLANGSDIWLANGVLHFIEEQVADILGGLHNKPLHLIINKTPLWDGDQFVTLQSLGTAFCPTYIFNRQQFIASICEQGYELIDVWSNAELSCSIPFSEKHSVNAYSGLYFRKSG